MAEITVEDITPAEPAIETVPEVPEAVPEAEPVREPVTIQTSQGEVTFAAAPKKRGRPKGKGETEATESTARRICRAAALCRAPTTDRHRCSATTGLSCIYGHERDAEAGAAKRSLPRSLLWDDRVLKPCLV